jgi:hypothetical protein
MKTTEQLRTALLDAKELFDRATFDRGLTPPERLIRWQAFLQKVAPLSQELKKAERREQKRAQRRVWEQMRGTAAVL